MKKRILILMSTLFFGSLSAQNHPCIDTVDVKVYFRQGYSILEPSFRDNGPRLDTFRRKIAELRQDTTCRIQSIHISTSASPEGSSVSNKRLSRKRAEQIVDFMRRSTCFPDSLFEVDSRSVDWQRLTDLVETSNMPYRDDVLRVLRNTPEWVIKKGIVVDGRKRQLGMLHGGRAWWYMYEHLFPELRSSDFYVICRIERLPTFVTTPCDTVVKEVVPVQPDTIILRDTAEVCDFEKRERKPFYMAMKTNMLYDAALVPNIGAEFYVGKGWTVGANWMYAWWWSNKQHNYWRIYGGELDVRKYFGERARQKPLTGHHVGIYGQMLTYDFETGGTGYLSKLSYGAGVEYGYSLPIGRRLNIDFGIGIGYLGGEYKVYDPKDGCYVWRETKQRRWFGPTKAEVSLVWLIGRGNYNEKGGKR